MRRGIPFIMPFVLLPCSDSRVPVRHFHFSEHPVICCVIIQEPFGINTALSLIAIRYDLRKRGRNKNIIAIFFRERVIRERSVRERYKRSFRFLLMCIAHSRRLIFRFCIFLFFTLCLCNCICIFFFISVFLSYLFLYLYLYLSLYLYQSQLCFLCSVVLFCFLPVLLQLSRG